MNLDTWFMTKEPYQITDKITGRSELSYDLASHVYLILYSKDSIKDIAAFFATCAYHQWNWSTSDFNKEYRPDKFIYHSVELTGSEVEEVAQKTIHSEVLKDYMNDKCSDVHEWYTKEIAKLVMSGMTYKQIEKRTKINVRYITEAINKFKDDARNYYNSNRFKYGIEHITPAEY